MNVTAKFECESVTHTDGNGYSSDVVKLRAVTSGADNNSWSKWTPSGDISMTITNPEALKAFKPGKAYFLTFTEETK